MYSGGLLCIYNRDHSALASALNKTTYTPKSISKSVAQSIKIIFIASGERAEN